MVGKSPVDRGKLGSKMTIITDEDSIPLCATFAAGNIADTTQLVPTLAAARHQLGDLARFRDFVEDKGYDSAANREACRRHGLIPSIIARQRRPAARNRNFATQAQRRSNGSAVRALPPSDENAGRVEDRRRPVESAFSREHIFA